MNNVFQNYCQDHSLLSTNSSSTNDNNVLLDIGNFVGKTPNNLLKRNLLLKLWVLPKHYVFPYSVHNKQGKQEKRHAGHKYLDSSKWLTFSDSKQGFFCKYCPFFVDLLVGEHCKTVPLNKLVTQPLTSFAKLLGKDGALYTHEKNYISLTHRRSCESILNVQENENFEN